MIIPTRKTPAILVVEDETLMAMDIQYRLEGLGYLVTGLAVSAEQALHSIQTRPPNLVFMDIALKGSMDGVQAAEIIRQQYNIPVVFLTANADKITLQRASLAQAFGFILKPFTNDELSSAVEIALYRHQMDARLVESENRLRAIFESVQDGLFLISDDGHVLDANPAGCSMLGYQREEIVGADIRSLVFDARQEAAPLALFQSRTAGSQSGATSSPLYEYRLRRKNGSERWVEMSIAPVLSGLVNQVVSIFRDISERKLLEGHPAQGSFYDVLTQLPNRLLFIERLNRALERCQRNETLRYAVLFMDLDRFKVINNSLGHHAGDQLLIQFGQRVGGVLRASDTLARLGGDEFAVLLEDLAGIADALLVAERILDEVKRPFDLRNQLIFISTSIGVVFDSTDYSSPDDILRDADIAMYRAKAEGKARYAIFDHQLRAQAMTRLEMETDLQMALERQELQVHYQPILSLANGKVEGFEALLRWMHPKFGEILPNNFIPLAEETGLILPIGWWVLSEACRALGTWQRLYPSQPPLTMSVNIASRQLAHMEMMPRVRLALAQSGIDPRSLKLEITETQLLDHSPETVDAMNQLRTLGIQLMVDDFGMGFSSLSYVQRFPIDTIKIDRLFINQINSSNAFPEVARMIISLAHELGMGTIAEGIETAEQFERLRKLDCPYGQGFLFSKALDSGRVHSLLDRLQAMPEASQAEIIQLCNDLSP